MKTQDILRSNIFIYVNKVLQFIFYGFNQIRKNPPVDPSILKSFGMFGSRSNPDSRTSFPIH